MIAPTALPDEIAAALAGAAARVRPIGHRVLWYDEVPSTNDVAATLAASGSEEGTLVLADMQTSGRGRIGRSWASPPGAGIYASLVLRPPAQVGSVLTIASGVAIAEGIAGASGLEAELKWPNDVHCRRRKLAGILAERGPDHVVLGFGINVLRAVYPADVRDRATSIEVELDRPVDRALVLTECLASLISRYRDLIEGRTLDVIAQWQRRGASMRGRRVEWDAGGATHQGTAETIDDEGALMVRSESGLIRVISGEVRWTS